MFRILASVLLALLIAAPAAVASSEGRVVKAGLKICEGRGVGNAPTWIYANGEHLLIIADEEGNLHIPAAFQDWEYDADKIALVHGDAILPLEFMCGHE